MRKKISILVVISLMLSGCVYIHSDSRLRLIVEGVVYDKTLDIPLNKVLVEFVDTGFDYTLSKQFMSYKIGESDEFGRINLEFDYSWGWVYGPFYGTPLKTFDILVSKKFYKSKRFYFKATDLTEIEGRLYVPLKKIYLEPD